MPKFPLKLPQMRRIFRRSAPLALTFLLSSAQLAHTYAPCALACVALAGPGLSGLLALLGAAGGTFLFFDFQPGLRFLASAILIYAASTAFFDTRLYTHPLFRPAVAAAMTALVQSIWLLERPLALTVVFLLSLALQWTAYALLSPLQAEKPSLEARRRGALFLLASLGLALTPVMLLSFSPGRALLTVLLLQIAAAPPATAAAIGAAVGLTVDLSAPEPTLLFTAVMACGCTLAAVQPRRWLSATLYCAGAVGIALLFDADKPLVLLWESMAGSFFYLLLPSANTSAEESLPDALPPSPLQHQLAQSAAAFRDLYDSFFRGTAPPPPENPAVLFDRTAQQVCRKCVLRQTCWQQDYNATYNAFNDACPHLLRRGQAQARDFPSYFTSRCVHMPDFLSTLNGELRTFLLRRQYHQRLAEVRRQAQEQYAQLGDLLSATATVEVMATTPLGYGIGSALRPREGCRVCGDQLAVFEVGSTLYLLLSDGMGSGESAHREAAMTVRLLRQFLEAGIDPAPALKTLNAAMALRGEEGGGFTTIDLLALQRSGGSAVLYKYGAAPSYLKRSGTVSRFTAAGLPAGLHSGSQEPGCSRFALPGGAFFVMVSDGIADETDDEWLQNLLAGWSGTDPEALTQLILRESRSRKGLQDDCAVLCLYLGSPENGTKRSI